VLLSPDQCSALAAARGDLPHREGLGVRAERHRLAGREKGRHVGVVMLGERDPAAVRRDAIIRDPVADQVLALVLPVQIRAVQRELGLFDVAGVQQPCPVGGKLRPRALVEHASQVRAVGVDDVQPRVLRPVGRGEIAAGHLAEGHPPAVGREARLDVVAGLGRQHLRAAPAERRDAHRAEGLVFEGRIDDVAAVRREGRMELPVLGLAGQAPPLVALEVMHPQIAERLVDRRAAVGAQLRPAQHAHVELLGVDLDRAPQRRVDLLLGPHPDLDGAMPAFETHAMEAAAGPEHQAAAVGQPVVGRVVTHVAAGFLLVALQPVEHGALDARDQVLDHEPAGERLGVAPHEGELAAVGRDHGPDRAARARDDRFHLAGLAIEALDGEDPGVRVLVVLPDLAGGHVLAEIEVAAVAREIRLGDVLLRLRAVQPLHQLDAAAAAAVVQPDGARRDAAL
jgi:hypothetical protein